VNTIIWDGEMDVGWEDLTNQISTIADRFTAEALRCAKYSNNGQIQKLITESSMSRFNAIIGAITSDLSEGFYYETEDLTGDTGGDSLKMKSWIMLGSAIESSLQIFLSVYLSDYNKSHWQQWKDFAEAETKDAIAATIKSLVDANTIDAAQGRSIREAVKDEIRLHSKPHPIERVMLDELILFFEKNEIFDKDDIDELRNIQSNRNCIHAYMERIIGTWMDLQYATRFFGYLMENMLNRFPDIDNVKE
jgi:hypothetical protein